MTRSEQKRILARAAAYILILALIGLHATMALAQTVTAEADVSWTLPTTDTLGQPLTGDRALKKVQLYVSTSPITDDTTVTPIDLPPGATTYVYEQAVPNGSTLYFRLRACNQICSALSADTPESRKEIRVSVPNVPTGVTVTLQVNLSITEP